MSLVFTVDGNYVNFNGGGNMHRMHKDSNCIAWHFDQTGDLFFDVYDQQYSVKAENIGTVIINGVPLSAASDFGDAIIAVFPGLGGGGSPGGSSYLVYDSVGDFPATGQEEIIYEAQDTGAIYKWDGSYTGFVAPGCLIVRDDSAEDATIIHQVESDRLSIGNYNEAGTEPSIQIRKALNQVLIDSRVFSWDFPAGSNGYFEISGTSAWAFLLDKVNDKIGIGDLNDYESGTRIIVKPSARQIIMEDIQEYADNSAAVTAGFPVGGIYRTGDALKIVH